ncbi:type II toxin-antitoxin system PemK/MazF family toxin [Austwickia chelonae]|uniref:type II toxin-antitoxin system PemK/MazF family toxin n=1 Tax=Austwickia chelonae TaxID=100225 RepID=UPI000E263A0D|nr:type II toxin-antitoxin system PemK/MazF family toxin [Austwickia chelonae]
MNIKAVLRSLARTLLGAGRVGSPSGEPAGPDSLKANSGIPRIYPGDFTGPLRPRYAPVDDDQPDPGEIVWAWVPYEEDHSQGKDRPALIIGRDKDWLLALPVTSKNHDRDARQEASVGRYWTDIGTGDWDSRGRPSEVRVNRVVRLAPSSVRRIGAKLDRARFDKVCAEMSRRR